MGEYEARKSTESRRARQAASPSSPRREARDGNGRSRAPAPRAGAPSAVAIFERLLSLKGQDRYELSARYWLVRALQNSKSVRAAKEAEVILSKFPFSYFGLKLKAESLQGQLEWPYPLETAETLKANFKFTAPQKKAWDRLRTLTAAGWRKVRDAAPGHSAMVRELVIDALTPEQVTQLAAIGEAILGRLDPDGAKTSTYHRYDG